MDGQLFTTVSEATPDVIPVLQARQLLLDGEVEKGRALLEANADQDLAMFLMAQLQAFENNWSPVRSLCLQLLQRPFALCQYRDAQDVMKLYILAVQQKGDWPEAKGEIEIVHDFLDNLLDMTAGSNSYAESFNRFESYIWSAGKGSTPFRINSPLTFASMGEEQYARLLSISSGKSQTFAQLDKNNQHDFHLWKALYDEDLDRALKLYEDDSSFVRSLTQATLIAQLLATFGQEDRAWQIIKQQISKWTPQHSWEIAPLDLLWDEKTRPLMTPERCLELLTIPRAAAWLEQENKKDSWIREKFTHICLLAHCLKEEVLAELEERCRGEATNLDLRVMLIGAYSKKLGQNADLKKPHIKWIIANHPRARLFEDLIPHLLVDKATAPDDFTEIREQWLEIIEENPEDTRVLFNASLMLGVDDQSLAEELLHRCQHLEPQNPKFAEALYELNAFQVNALAADENAVNQRLSHARETLRQVAIMEKLAGPDFDKLRILRRRAWFSLEAGELDQCARISNDMLITARAQGVEEAYQYLNKVLAARLSLKVGDIPRALEALAQLKDLEPGKHFKEESPYLTLLAELYSAGEGKAALEFLLATRADWPAGNQSLLQRVMAELGENTRPWVPAVRL